MLTSKRAIILKYSILCFSFQHDHQKFKINSVSSFRLFRGISPSIRNSLHLNFLLDIYLKIL